MGRTTMVKDGMKKDRLNTSPPRKNKERLGFLINNKEIDIHNPASSSALYNKVVVEDG